MFKKAYQTPGLLSRGRKMVPGTIFTCGNRGSFPAVDGNPLLDVRRKDLYARRIIGAKHHLLEHGVLKMHLMTCLVLCASVRAVPALAMEAEKPAIAVADFTANNASATDAAVLSELVRESVINSGMFT
jgi:hypothetical protein